MKPNGIEFTSPYPSMRVTRPSAPEDAVWDAVEKAIAAGWDARRFRLEAAEAWQHELREAAKEAVRELTAPKEPR